MKNLLATLNFGLESTNPHRKEVTVRASGAKEARLNYSILFLVPVSCSVVSKSATRIASIAVFNVS